MSNISTEKTIELLNLLRFDNSIPSKFVDNRKLYQWGRNEIIDNTIGKIKELIVENEQLKSKYENAPINPSEPKYTPTCPRGYTDCVYDPAYIKLNYPDWYKELYGNKTPVKASRECKERMIKDPNEKNHCYDNEDK